MSQNLSGKHAIISGSSAGIGAAIAIELSRRGANIVLNYPFPELENECNEVGQHLITPWISVCQDLSTPEGPENLIANAVKKFGPIDILVSNAARVVTANSWELELENYRKAMDLNAQGFFLLVKATVPHLRPYTPAESPAERGSGGGGRIIFISSGTARLAQPGLLAYAATKGAGESMLRVLAFELPPKYGCTVNAVAPGPIDTKQFRINAGEHLDEALEQFAMFTPVPGAVGEPEDIAHAVAFLADEKSKWINGQVLQVNGGLSMP